MRHMIVGQAFLIVAAIPFTLTSAAAQSVSTVPEAVERYARHLDAAINSSGPVYLEQIFEEGASAAKALVRGQLEQLDQPTYKKVMDMMAGFWVTREEAVMAVANPDFFLKLAREKGTNADRAFFEALKKTYPDSSWPAYTEAQTDYSGCTVFDGKKLTETYDAWTAFQAAYPNRYRASAREELEQVETALESDCVCGGEDAYQKELENFLKSHPNMPAAAKLESNLKAVKNHTSKIRFHCKPR